MGCASNQKQAALPEPFEVETAPYVMKWQQRQVAVEPSIYKITGTCGGFPKVNVKTAPGFCLGLIDNGENTIFPRTAIEIANKEILVVDMGGWDEYKGRIYSLKYANGKYTRSVLLDATTLKNPAKKPALDKPHLILRGPDGLMYLGAAGTLSRFNPKAANVEASLEIIISNIPKQGLHPLKAFTFDDQGNLFVNVGSATNVCQKEGIKFKRSNFCTEAEENEIGQALIRKYTRQADGRYSPNYQIYARGLRNSMGLYWSKSNQVLLQLENGRDDISNMDVSLSNLNFPHEEMNIIQEGKHYGWPYCYDNNVINPEWKHLNCESYVAPHLLLPAHSSPLSMINYQGNMFPAWYKNRFIVSLHGFEARGHRLVTFLRNDKALPVGKPLSIVYGWDKNSPQFAGNPVGLSEMADGSVLVVEDNTRKVLRLFYDAKLGDGKPLDEIPEVVVQSEDDKKRIEALRLNLRKALNDPNPPLFALVQEHMIDKHCASCHSGADARGMQLDQFDYVRNENRILQKKKAQDILSRIKGDGHLPQMPPDGFTNPEEQKYLVDLYLRWLNSK